MIISVYNDPKYKDKELSFQERIQLASVIISALGLTLSSIQLTLYLMEGEKNA